MTKQPTLSQLISLGLVVALTGTVWTIALSHQPSLYG